MMKSTLKFMVLVPVLALLTCIIPFDTPYTGPYVAPGLDHIPGIWKNVSLHYTDTGDTLHPRIDTTMPVSTVTYDSLAKAQVDLYTAFTPDSVIGYQYYVGDSVYYRVTQPVTPDAGTENSFIVTPESVESLFGSIGMTVTTKYQYLDSRLVRTTVMRTGSRTVTAVNTFDMADQFPPSDWPWMPVYLN